jgi:stage III sporulation protein AE
MVILLTPDSKKYESPEVVRFMNGISEEEYLSKFSELMETGAGWILKALLGIVIGLNIIQGMIAPAIDTVKRSVVSRSAEAIPGIGDALGGATEVVLGTAVLVKNGIGAAGAVVSIGICVIPVIQILMLTVFYKVSAAIVQPVADKRMVECISSVGEGCQLLLKVIFAVAVLFLLTIAIVSSATG